MFFVGKNKIDRLLVVLILLSLFLWSFVFFVPGLEKIVGDFDIPPSTEIVGSYVLLILSSIFFVYLLIGFFAIKQKKFTWRLSTIFLLFFIFSIILLSVFPLISSDVLNYPIYTRIFSHYSENPYELSPSNFTFDSYYQKYNNLNFQDYTLPYGPLWLSLSVIPTWLGGENHDLTYFLFKLMAVLFSLGCLILVYKITEIIKPEMKNLAAFLYALNPLILLQTAIDGHNDIIMTFFVLLAFYALLKEKYYFSVVFLFFSVFIKFISILLLPLFFVYVYHKTSKIKVLKMLLVGAIPLVVLCLICGCFNLTMFKSLLLRGEVFYPKLISIFIFLIYKLAELFEQFDAQALAMHGSLVVFVLLYLLLFIKGNYKKFSQLIIGSIYVYLLYLLVACFLFFGWYLLWVLPLLLIVFTRRNQILFFILTIVGLLSACFYYAIVSLLAICVFVIIYLGLKKFKKNNRYV